MTDIVGGRPVAIRFAGRLRVAAAKLSGAPHTVDLGTVIPRGEGEGPSGDQDAAASRTSAPAPDHPEG
jgi:hypothetical protein